MADSRLNLTVAKPRALMVKNTTISPRQRPRRVRAMAATANTRALASTRTGLFFEHDPGLDDITYCWGRPSRPVKFRTTIIGANINLPKIVGPRKAGIFEPISPAGSYIKVARQGLDHRAMRGSIKTPDFEIA